MIRLTLDQMRTSSPSPRPAAFQPRPDGLGRVQSAVSQAVNTLEQVLGVPLFDRTGKTPRLTEAGVVILKDARRLINGAQTMKARAASILTDVEPELSLAVDGAFPNDLLMASLKALRVEFPQLPVSVFTEGMGGAEQRLRDGLVQFAIYPIAPVIAHDLTADFLTHVALIPVVAVGHPLASEPALITREMLEPHVQLVLTDRAPPPQQTSAAASSATTSGVSPILRRGWNFSSPASAVQYARPYGRRSYRRGKAQTSRNGRARLLRIQPSCGARTRPRNRPRRTLAYR